jgi:hypothetical protein
MTEKTDEFGLPVRYNRAAGYRGRAVVVYGHPPVPQPDWRRGPRWDAFRAGMHPSLGYTASTVGLARD